jgi:hypothetical protein
MPMKWAAAVKMWNMHGKIYNPRHVYAIPRKGSPEYLDVKHIQEHDELPTHLKKKGPFPPEALEQLRKHAEESTARREAAERKRLTEEIEKVRSPKLRIVEPEPEIKVPALPERLEKKEKKTTTPAKAKVIAAILEEAKKRKAAAPAPAPPTEKKITPPKSGIVVHYKNLPKPPPPPPSKPVTRRRKIFKHLFDLLGGPASKRKGEQAKKELAKVEPDLATNESIGSLLTGKFGSFYPTPPECLEKNKMIVNLIEHGHNFLEPCAGIGSIVDVIETWNPTAKIEANELNPGLANILKSFFPKIKVETKDFFTYPNKNNFDTILCNPPFEGGLYFQFLFKCLNMMNESTSKRRPHLLFICPKIKMDFGYTHTEGENDSFDETMFFSESSILSALTKYVKENNLLYLDDKKKISDKQFKTILQNYYKDNATDEQVSLGEDVLNQIVNHHFGFVEAAYCGDCTGFGGTNITASIYLFTGYMKHDTDDESED